MTSDLGQSFFLANLFLYTYLHIYLANPSSFFLVPTAAILTPVESPDFVVSLTTPTICHLPLCVYENRVHTQANHSLRGALLLACLSFLHSYQSVCLLIFSLCELLFHSSVFIPCSHVVSPPEPIPEYGYRSKIRIPPLIGQQYMSYATTSNWWLVLPFPFTATIASPIIPAVTRIDPCPYIQGFFSLGYSGNARERRRTRRSSRAWQILLSIRLLIYIKPNSYPASLVKETTLY